YILVADDEAAIRFMIGELLLSEGYEVREARNGREALALMCLDVPELIVLDLMMPVMNGFEFLQMLPEAGPSSPPILAITAMHPRDPALAGLPVTALLPKPFDVGRLLSE